MRNDYTFTENGVLMDVLRMSYISSCGAKRPVPIITQRRAKLCHRPTCSSPYIYIYIYIYVSV